MMKSLNRMLIGGLMTCVLIGSLAACGQDDGSAGKTGIGVYSTSKSVNDVLEEQAGSAGDNGSASADSTEAGSDAVAEAAGTAGNADGTSTSSGDGADSTDDTKAAMDAVNSQLAAADEQAKAVAGGDVDVDLTKLTSTMVYSEVYNMVTDPSQYMGKTVRMQGTTSVYHDDVDNNDYYACVIQDATACCAQGIEFVLNDGKYPDANSEVTVVGTFSSYKIADYEYYTLKDATVERVE
ncbi:MAG: hypothetical protein IJ661_03245 [Lachnospiraceae bacterium]|nr:hypothetical protein [Lachnospiraceae bacterium]